ncbi:hypothetical protein AVEN_249960-1 [Araneus ventricosus]|uniref:Uncharacterized protein n=1 Tax=Araneus ventricosus TaxID=182803 RepID=A0A4Y2U682_ARAVE|nr:hypothetical protein AVEN_203346-1 [Araneus ventricosus]GBO07590.1 hypothetical protein AVEN_249960-1 [Araneus ventricosus]
MKLVSVTQVYLVTKKIEPSLVAVLLLKPSKNLRLLRSSHLPFYSLVLLLGERSRKNLSTNPRPFCKWSPPQRALIGSLPFLGWSFRRQRFLMLEIIDPFHHVH